MIYNNSIRLTHHPDNTFSRYNQNKITAPIPKPSAVFTLKSLNGLLCSIHTCVTVCVLTHTMTHVYTWYIVLLSLQNKRKTKQYTPLGWIASRLISSECHYRLCRLISLLPFVMLHPHPSFLLTGISGKRPVPDQCNLQHWLRTLTLAQQPFNLC